jgi:transmembrane sensor
LGRKRVAAASTDEEALRWMGRTMSGAMSAEEKQAFAAWLAQSADNVAAFSRLRSAVGRIDAAGEALLAEEFERQLAAAEARPERRFSPLAIAASVAAAAALIGVAMLIAAPRRAAQSAVYATEIGEIDRLALADGTRVEINALSRIAVSLTAHERRVDVIEGDAFFTVAADAARPFVVMTRMARIEAMGTAFGVSAQDDMAMVRVVDGMVKVAPIDGDAATLRGGEMIAVGMRGLKGAVERFDADIALAWRAGRVRFDGEPLSQAVASLNRYFQPPIDLSDAAVAALPIAGEFDIGDRAAAIRTLNGLIEAHFARLVRDNRAPLIAADWGHLDGAPPDAAKAIVVEFFDYHCRDCRRNAEFVGALLRDDREVMVAFRENPRLREESVLASRYALAARAQGRYRDFHFALMRETAPLSEARIDEIAGAAGLDLARLKKDARDPAIARVIDDLRAVADEMGFGQKGSATVLVLTRAGELVAIVSGYDPAAVKAGIDAAKARG